MSESTHDLILRRLRSNTNGTFGVLMPADVTDAPFAVTLELPWKNNERRVSCIPAGTYTCKRVQSPRFGNTFEVTKVPNRTSILFHGGNIIDDSLGCILVGHGFDEVKGRDGIVNSTKEFAEFLARTKGLLEFQLTIIDP